MTTSTLNVGDLFSVLGARGIEKQLLRVVGVGRVSVNPVSGSTTVVYDSKKTSLQVIMKAIEDCGFHCMAEARPRHDLCDMPEAPNISRPEAPTSDIKAAHSPTHKDHTGMTSAGMKPVDPMAGHKAPIGDKAHATRWRKATPRRMGGKERCDGT